MQRPTTLQINIEYDAENLRHDPFSITRFEVSNERGTFRYRDSTLSSRLFINGQACMSSDQKTLRTTFEQWVGFSIDQLEHWFANDRN